MTTTKTEFVIQVNRDCDKCGVYEREWHDLGSHDFGNSYSYNTFDEAVDVLYNTPQFTLVYETAHNGFIHYKIDKSCLRLIKRTIIEELSVTIHK